MNNNILFLPMEEHCFEGHENDFRCQVCDRPRVCHYRYPFHATLSNLDPSEPYVPYRGAHPRFKKPGTKEREPVPVVSGRAVDEGERIRRAQRERIQKAVNRLDGSVGWGKNDL